MTKYFNIDIMTIVAYDIQSVSYYNLVKAFDYITII